MSFKGRAVKINSHLISLGGEKIKWEIALYPEVFLARKVLVSKFIHSKKAKNMTKSPNFYWCYFVGSKKFGDFVIFLWPTQNI